MRSEDELGPIRIVLFGVEHLNELLYHEGVQAAVELIDNNSFSMGKAHEERGVQIQQIPRAK